MSCSVFIKVCKEIRYSPKI